MTPNISFARLVLPERQIAQLRRVVDEHRRRELLAGAGLSPTKRLLFHGPPGSGKTLAAQVVASALGYPLATVRFDAIVSSFLGETAANLGKVFDYIGEARLVVLFDEFDAIAKERSDESEHGELKRVVNALLQLMDAYDGPSVLIAATNHETLLDSAIWRRFEMIVRFALPQHQDRVLMLRSFLRGSSYDERSLETVAKETSGASGADLESIALLAARSAVLGLRTSIAPSDFELAVREFEERGRLLEEGVGATAD